MAFYFFSVLVTFPRNAIELRFSAMKKISSTAPTYLFLSFFLYIAADREFFVAGVVDGYREAAGARVPARKQAMKRSYQLQIFHLTVKEDVAQKIGLWKR